MRIRGARFAFGLLIVPTLCAGMHTAYANDLYFPPAGGEWLKITPADAGFDASALDDAAIHAESEHSSAFLILYRGRIVYEKHWRIKKGSEHSSPRYQRMLQGYADDGQAIEDVASVQKSVVSFLAGRAVTDGKLNIGKPVSKYLKPGWSHATPEQESQVTVHHLMTMTSGLTDGLEYRKPAGSQWRYNTGAYSQMIPVLEKVFAKPIDQVTSELLTRRIGMTDSKWVPRPWGASNDAANNVGFATTARDLGRFGLLILARGEWEGESLGVSQAYLDKMLSPSQELNPSYGLLWWLNGQSYSLAPGVRGRRDGALLPTGPSDIVAALGALGRKVYVSRGTQLVVVRLGNQPSRSFDAELWRLIIKARTAE